MTELTETINIAVTPKLKAAIKAQAERESRKYTALARVTLERIFLANEVTLEQCADYDVLHLPPNEFEATWQEFMRQRATPVQPEARTLVDPGVDYDTGVE